MSLGRTMIDIGTSLGRKVCAMVTDMDEPLGNAIGNALEVREAIDTLRGHGPWDFTQLCLTAGTHMLLQAGLFNDEADARAKLMESIESGAALDKLKVMVKAQGGDVCQIENPELLPKSVYITEMQSRQDGYIAHMQAMHLGTLAMKIGAGRETIEDKILPGTGIVLCIKVGGQVRRGQVLARVYHDQPLEPGWVEEFYDSYTFSEQPVSRLPLVYTVLN